MEAEAPRIVTTAPPGVRLRSVEDRDLPFLAELYASTRREEVAQTPWSEEQKEAFLRWQFENQHWHYREYYPSCELLVIEEDGGTGEGSGAAAEEVGGEVAAEPGTGASSAPIGRLYVDRWPDQIRLVDISLLPEHRGRGLGTALLGELLAEGEARGLPVTIHVEFNNPALFLYRRLGFRHVDSNGIYYLMKWTPPNLSS